MERKDCFIRTVTFRSYSKSKDPKLRTITVEVDERELEGLSNVLDIELVYESCIRKAFKNIVNAA